ncbi:MAG: TRAP transporter fused permease subunit [Syntrophaceae bacterium]|nr:TRAP transporter fused permease subunit [Syntrophaceae bacterium]
MLREQIKHHVTLRNLFFALSIVMFVWLIWYFYTGYGGPSELVTYLVPLALTLQILSMYQKDYLYKRLPPIVNHILVVLYIGICVYAFYHFVIEYEQIAIWRQGSYTREDFIVGLLVFLLVMELSRIAHTILFWVNSVLVVYTLYGYLSPIDFFWHPGTSFYRVITSSTVELSTGIYGLYAQIALTVIAAFLLLAAAARGFDAQGAMVNVMRKLAGRSRRTVPQTAVLASASVGLISGSGAANAAVVGSFTIPLMIRHGFPGAFAAAVEVGASMGGLIMPPVMAVAGFIMAEFLGVPYWDVVIRGFSLAFVYYGTLSLSVYLLSVRLMPSDPIEATTVPLYDRIKTTIFFSAIGFLIVLMGWLNYGPLLAALYTGGYMFSLLILAYFYFKFVLKDPAVGKESLFANIRLTIETHAEMTSYLTLLLSTLGIMIGLFTVTGFINRMGGILLHIGEWHVIALILMAWVFGWLVGAGLPPTATYIILAVIIVEPMRKLGIDPWVANFFAFLLAVWGELSPPTSLTAAVSARIAEASFMRTMWESLKLCLPITFMSFTIFARSDMVTHPGWPQIAATLLVAIACCGMTFAIFGRFFANMGSDVMLRGALAVASLVVLLHPDSNVALAAAVIVLPATIYGVARHRRIAPPKNGSGLQPQPAT